MGVECRIFTQGDIFRPGQPVLGTVKYVINKPTQFKSIDISLVGEGTCRWSDLIVYENKEVYVNEKRNLFIARDDQEVLLTGTFEYPFQFLLPEDIPSSIKNGTGGIIEYKLIVKFVKAKRFRTINEFCREIPVYGYVSPCSPEPMTFGLHKNLFSLTYNVNVDVKAEIEKTFLTPGENIKLKLTINNDTNDPITIVTELIEYFTSISEDKITNVVSKTIETSKLKYKDIAEKSLSIITCNMPTSPSLCSIQNSKILIGEYRVKVTAKLPFLHTDAEVEVPVVIGYRRDNLDGAAVGYDDENTFSSKTTEPDEINLIEL